jgi:hypothetical protein
MSCGEVALYGKEYWENIWPGMLEIGLKHGLEPPELTTWESAILFISSIEESPYEF